MQQGWKDNSELETFHAPHLLSVENKEDWVEREHKTQSAWWGLQRLKIELLEDE
jgi:hypothetical protein